MTKRIGLVLTLLCMGVLVGRAVWPGIKGIPEVEVSADMKQKAQSKNPFHDVNEKAKHARAGDLKSIRELADDIITRYGFLEFATAAKHSMAERLVRAEARFQKEGSGGIPEKNIVTMINNLAVELAAPEFMKTDLVQVRHIRMARMVFLPNLINQPPRGQSGANRRTKGSSVNETMSPLEAVFVAMDLIYQKTNSDDFQVSPREYRSNLNKKRLEMWQAHQVSKSNRGLAADETTAEPVYQMKESEPSAKSAELRLPKSRAAAMKPSDLLNLANTALDTLGIAH